MPADSEPMASPPSAMSNVAARPDPTGTCGRLLWFALLWSAGVASLSALAIPLRWLMKSI